jgi:chitinase
MRPTLFFVLALVVPAAGCSAGPNLQPPSQGTTGASASNDDAGTLGTTTTTSSSGGSTPNEGDDAGATGSNAPPTSDDGGSVPLTSDGGHDGATPTAPKGSDYAPYFPTWVWGGSGYAFTGLADLQQKSGLNEVTIAFVLSNGGCNTTQDIEQNMSDVQAFIAKGGHVKASFGGADGTYVESACSDATSLAAAIAGFVEATGITDLDFDVEQDPAETDAVNAMRGQALASVQASHGIKVAFTLPANPSPNGGLTSEGLSVVSNAVSAGVTVSHVNFMTMDYGDSYGGAPLAPVVIGSLNDGQAQIMTLIPGISSAAAWGVVGVIPMIGKNDDSEVFSLADAQTLATFAKTNHVGLVSFWSIDRDQPGTDYNMASTVETTDFAFNAILSTTAQ